MYDCYYVARLSSWIPDNLQYLQNCDIYRRFCVTYPSNSWLHVVNCCSNHCREIYDKRNVERREAILYFGQLLLQSQFSRVNSTCWKIISSPFPVVASQLLAFFFANSFRNLIKCGFSSQCVRDVIKDRMRYTFSYYFSLNIHAVNLNYYASRIP